MAPGGDFEMQVKEEKASEELSATLDEGWFLLRDGLYCYVGCSMVFFVITPLFMDEVGSTAQNWVGFPSPDQLSYDNHHSLRVFIHWHQVRRLSIIAFFLSRGTFSKIAKYHGGHLRRHCWASYWELLRPRGKAHF